MLDTTANHLKYFKQSSEDLQTEHIDEYSYSHK